LISWYFVETLSYWPRHKNEWSLWFTFLEMFEFGKIHYNSRVNFFDLVFPSSRTTSWYYGLNSGLEKLFDKVEWLPPCIFSSITVIIRVNTQYYMPLSFFPSFFWLWYVDEHKDEFLLFSLSCVVIWMYAYVFWAKRKQVNK
jgi:hypothetical protein